MDYDIDKLDEYFPDLSDYARAQMTKHFHALVDHNNHASLISKSSVAFAARQHYGDCINGIQLIKDRAKLDNTVYDLGSGSGFPGIVLAILEPSIEVNLIERDMRRAEFLKYSVAELQLKNCRVHTQGVETLKRESVTCGLVRALGSVARVSIQVHPAFASGSHLYYFTGDNWGSELASCPPQVFTKWDIHSLGEYSVPETLSKKFILQAKKL